MNLLADEVDTITQIDNATKLLQGVEITPCDFIKHFKGIDEDKVRNINIYYAQYGWIYFIENLSWSSDRILDTRKGTMRDKVREGLVGVSALESGRPLVFKKWSTS